MHNRVCIVKIFICFVCCWFSVAYHTSSSVLDPQWVQLPYYVVSCSMLLLLAQQPSVGQGLLIYDVSRSHTTHHIRQDSSGRVISLSQRLLPDNMQHSQQTDIHAPVGFEPIISAGERPNTCASHPTATGTGRLKFTIMILKTKTQGKELHPRSAHQCLHITLTEFTAVHSDSSSYLQVLSIGPAVGRRKDAEHLQNFSFQFKLQPGHQMCQQQLFRAVAFTASTSA